MACRGTGFSCEWQWSGSGSASFGLIATLHHLSGSQLARESIDLEISIQWIQFQNMAIQIKTHPKFERVSYNFRIMMVLLGSGIDCLG